MLPKQVRPSDENLSEHSPVNFTIDREPNSP